MRFNWLGRTGVRVPELALGLGTQVGTADFDAKVSLSLDAGVCLIDTADAYSDGKSEELLGEVLVGRRNRVLLSTKATYRVGPGENDLGSSRLHLVAACEASLKRLRTDWIDFYQLHAPDPYTRPEETMRAMDDLVRSGKVRYIGCSNYSGSQVVRAQWAADSLRLQPFTFQQILYSLLNREAEFELFPVAEDQGMGSMIWGPLAAGFLTGKYRRDEARPDGSRLARLPTLPTVPDWNHAFRVLDVMQEIAARRAVPVGQVAINWLLSKPWVTSVILGANTLQQLKELLGSASWRLSAEDAASLDAVSEVTPLRYPYWVQRLGAPERNPPLKGFRE
ncbi:MAG: aldo/keto reductase [Steroidobacteraceae bacterium]